MSNLRLQLTTSEQAGYLPVWLQCMVGHRWSVLFAHVIRSTIFTADVQEVAACPTCGAQWGYLIESPDRTSGESQ